MTDVHVRENCGIIGRNLLSWAWKDRAGKTESWIERLVAVVAIPLVARTYDTNISESRVLLNDEHIIAKKYGLRQTQRPNQVRKERLLQVGAAHPAIFQIKALCASAAMRSNKTET
jgi:hypothetical protein